jgi:cell filamentation protein
MYAAVPDPYCYPNTTVLKNLRNLRSQKALDRFETVMTMWRGTQPTPKGRLSVRHYQALHQHLFQDVYAWAGKFRTVRISKGGSTFCYPEHIPGEMRRLFGALRDDRHLKGMEGAEFGRKAAHFLAELNAIHPFREGNGRTQLAFLAMLAENAGHPIDLDRMNPEEILTATIASFGGNEDILARVICNLIEKRWRAQPQ